MDALLTVLENAVGVSFLLLGVLTAHDWTRNRTPSRAWLAVAVGSLAMSSLLGRAQALWPQGAAVLQDLSVVTFLASGYALLMFRATFIPLPKRVLWAVQVGLATVGVIAMVAIGGSASQYTNSNFNIGTLLILVWCACVGEPVVRFYRASRGCPAVQRARLRSLSAGYAGLVLVLVIAIVAVALMTGGRGQARNPVFGVALELMALATVPLLYASLSPPNWLRRIWREPEERALREATGDLLLFSPSRSMLAGRGLEWATRLVGAEAAVVVGGAGEVLATRGVNDQQCQRLLTELRAITESSGWRSMQIELKDDGQVRTAIALPLPFNQGRPGALFVVSGSFTPLFGSEELILLSTYATSLTVGLDRVGMTEQLAALERGKSEFLNLASHELRGPVAVIRGYLSMIQEGTFGPVGDEIHQILPIMEAKATEMNSLVEQMLEVARLEEGRLELKAEQADLGALTARAVEMARPLADSHHPILIDGEQAEIPVVVDEQRITTIINNLLSNAIKYSPSGGGVECRVVREDRLAKIMVTDHGLGIGAPDIERLFSRFGRIVNADTAHIGGTGLGLYLSRELARMHGGDLTVESKLGVGSTFVLAVPVKKP